VDCKSTTKPVLTIVALGDSLTYARRSCAGKRYCDVLESELARRLADVAVPVVVNSGIGGNTAEDGLGRLGPDVMAHHPDLVLVEFAANDVLMKDPERFEANLDKVVGTILRETGARVILSTGPYINEKQNFFAGDREIVKSGGLNHYMQSEMTACVWKIADKYDLKVFDLYKVFADAIAGCDSKSERYIVDLDGIHWTTEGDALAGKAMAEFAAPVLGEIAASKKKITGVGPGPLLMPEPKLLELAGGGVGFFDALVASVKDIELIEPLVSAFAACGVSIVGEGNGMPLSVCEIDTAEFLPEDVPDGARAEAYRLKILPSSITIQSGRSAGARMGLATLAQYVRQLARSGSQPAVTITDWPVMIHRGVFMEDKWGTDLMTLDDWKGVVDKFAENKMNVMGVGLYGCWCVQYDLEVTEFLMVPIPGHPEIKKEWACRWFSPISGKWEDIRYLPKMYEQDFFGELVAYGQKRGVSVVPFVNSLGHNTLIPRMLPDVSSKDENGSPTGYGYCMSSSKTWEFITGFYGAIIDRYLAPNGADTFHIQMDEVYPLIGAHPDDPKRVVHPECKCAECAKKTNEEWIQDYLIRLVKFLVSRSIKNVVIWNDQLTRHMDLVDDAFIDRLKDEGVYENVVLHWWWYSNDMIHEKVHPKIGKGLRGWVGPMTCYFNWSYYRENHRNIANMLAMGHAEGAEGAVSYSVYDPACDFDFSLLADYSWDSRGSGSPRAALDKFSRLIEGVYGDELAKAIRALDQSVNGTPIHHVVYYTYTYPAEDKPYPRRYPLEALDFLAENSEEHPELLPGLRKMHSWAKRSRFLAEQIPPEKRSETARNILAEGARLEALAGCFLELVRIRAECDTLAVPGEFDAKELLYFQDVAVQMSRDLPERFAALMKIVEAEKPQYMRPSCLRDLSVMYEFLLQLKDDVTEANEGKLPWNDVRWFVDPCIAQRGL